MSRPLVAWSFYDWANSSFTTIIQTFIFATYFVSRVAPQKEQGVTDWGLAVGLSGLVVALVGPILGALADKGGHRKGWLAFFTLIVFLSIALMWFVRPRPQDQLLALLLIGISTAAAEFSYIFYNAMLPELTTPDHLGRWSGWGWAMGYVGGVIVLLLSLFLFIQPAIPDPEASHIRATFLFSALWYFVFALPIFFFTPELRTQSTQTFGQALQAMRTSFIEIKAYKTLFHFLIARMIYTDALITLFAFGGIYAAAQFGMSETEVLYFGISLNVFAGIGALGFAFLDDKVGGKTVILSALIGLILFGSLALLAPTRSQFWMFGLLMGMFVGPAQASSRSYLARLTPPSMRNQMFGFFALSSKLTAFLGPLSVSTVTYLTGSLPLGMSTIMAFLTLGFFLMLKVPSDK